MAVMNVNPTRMQLSKLKKQLTTAVRGHKMLKDKRDELMRQFLDLIRETRDLRDKVEAELEHCNAHFVNASAVMSKEALDAALLSPKQQIGVQIGSKNVMSVEIPQFETETRTADKGDIFPYGFAFTSFELDDRARNDSALSGDNKIHLHEARGKRPLQPHKADEGQGHAPRQGAPLFGMIKALTAERSGLYI